MKYQIDDRIFLDEYIVGLEDKDTGKILTLSEGKEIWKKKKDYWKRLGWSKEAIRKQQDEYFWDFFYPIYDEKVLKEYEKHN